METICQRCKIPIPQEHISRKSLLAICPRCQTASHVKLVEENTVKQTMPSPMGSAPKSILIKESDKKFSLVQNWATPTKFLIFFTVFWNAFLVFFAWFFLTLFYQESPLLITFSFLAPILLMLSVVGLFMIYKLLVGFFNKNKLILIKNVSPLLATPFRNTNRLLYHTLKSSYGPLWWPNKKNLKIYVSEIQSFYIKSYELYRENNHPVYRYMIYAKVKNSISLKIIDELANYEEAKFVQGVLEEQKKRNF